MAGGEAKKSIRERATSELREFCVISLYLFICFAAVAYMKASILQAEGIAFAPFGLAAAKALICAKFVLVGRALHLGERFKHQPLIWPTLHQSLAFLLFLLLLNFLEEGIVGYFHGRGFVASMTEVGGGTLHQLIATSVIGLLILIPYFAFRALGEVVGEHNLVMVFLRPRRRADRNATGSQPPAEAE